jgi:hypothetical protein
MQVSLPRLERRAFNPSGTAYGCAFRGTQVIAVIAVFAACLTLAAKPARGVTVDAGRRPSPVVD